MLRRSPLALAALLLALHAAPAAAAGIPGTDGYTPDPLNAEPFRPALDPGGLLTTESPAVAGRLAARADVWAAHNLLIWTPEDGEQLDLVGDTLTVHLAAGRTLGRTRLAVATPLHLLTSSDTFTTPALVAGDVRLSLKRPLTSWAAVQLDGSVAVGGSRYQLGSPAPTLDASTALGWRGEQRALLANVGLRLQQTTTLDTLSAGELELGSGLWYRAGVAQALGAAHRRELTAEVHGMVASSSVYGQPLEALLGVQQRTPERGQQVRLGVGVGLRQGIGAPTWRLLLGVGQDQAAPPAPVAAPTLAPGDLPPSP